jgi:uncharacterized membrane protein YbhN (UPF0104 family)
VLLVFLFSRLNWTGFLDQLSNIRHGYLFLAIFIYWLIQAGCAYRWKTLAEVQGLSAPLKKFVLYYYIGMFFNLFLPTSIGGDIGKCYLLSRGRAHLKQAVLSVLADRGVGFAAMTAIALAALSQSSVLTIPPVLRWTLYFSGGLFFLAFLIPFSAGSRIQARWPRLSPVMNYWKSPGLLAYLFALSLVLQGSVIGLHILVGKAVGLSLPAGYYFVFTPLVVAISMIPVSLNGLGLREGAYIYFLRQADVPIETGMAFGLSWFVILFVSGLVGGIAWILSAERLTGIK